MSGRGRLWAVGVMAVIALLAACDPSNLAATLPVIVNREDGGLLIDVPLCQGDRILSADAQGTGGEERIAKRVDLSATKRPPRVARLTFTEATLNDSTFNQTELAPDPGYNRGSFASAADVTSLGVTTTIGTVSVTVEDLPVDEDGPWLVVGSGRPGAATSEVVDSLLSDWCDKP